MRKSERNRAGQHQILKSLASYRGLAREYWPSINLDDVYVDFDLTGTCAGMAFWKSGRIRINVDLLTSDTLTEMVEQTLPHELAHIIANRLSGKTVHHQLPWKRVMRTLGLEPVRCHDMEVEHLRRKIRTAPARCNCRTMMLTSRRVNKMKRGTTYTCGKCHSRIELTGVLS